MLFTRECCLALKAKSSLMLSGLFETLMMFRSFNRFVSVYDRCVCVSLFLFLQRSCRCWKEVSWQGQDYRQIIRSFERRVYLFQYLYEVLACFLPLVIWSSPYGAVYFLLKCAKNFKKKKLQEQSFVCGRTWFKFINFKTS